ncbi:unnamed protein product [Caenorhabditis bovis]|uniref:MAU2 chromatid cohesion factor homolog n=1 Tax=Caenorhabditis bovis TaxID=2654633 RepID=A0A8S1F8P6_9PELO|nr:unnamed protein product [Caenorhabditis bovis]
MLEHNQIAMSMLAMAETLRTQHPPKLKMAIKCARGALKLNLSPETVAHCQLQLGKLLLFYTDHYEIARQHLHYAYESLTTMGDFYVLKRLEALSLLCDLYIHSQMWPMNTILGLIRKEMGYAKQFSHYHHKLLLYFIEACKIERNTKAALDACDLAIQSIESHKPMELYFRITKHLVRYQMLREEPDPQDVLQIGAMIKELEQNPIMEFHLKNIKGFFMCTKLAFMLSEGLSRTSRSLLRQLQHEVTTTSKDCINGIRWMDETAMTVFACVMTVVSAVVQCSYDRAYKYHMIAIKHADDIITKSTRTPQEFAVVRCINQMKMTSLELMATCNIMACRPDACLNNMRDMIIFSSRCGGEILQREFEPHLQYLLGMLCSYTKQYDLAERHFASAIEMYSKRGNDSNILCLLYVNLALTYLNQMKLVEYYDIAAHLAPSRIADCSPMVRNNVKFLNAIYYHLNQKPNECKSVIHELLQDAKAEDFFRLHGLALLMLSLLAPVDETSVKPTVDWSKKSYDHAVVLWSHNFYAKLLSRRGEDTTEIMAEITKSFDALNVDHLIRQSMESQAANLVNWVDGNVHDYMPKDDL